MKHYEIRKPVFDEHGFAGFDTYPEKFATLEDAKNKYNSLNSSRLCIFEVQITETKVF